MLLFVCRRALSLWLLVAVSLAVYPARAQQYDNLVNLQRRANALKAAGRYEEAVALAQQLVSLAESAFQSKPNLISTCLIDLANIYIDQGRYAEAEPLYLRALKIDETTLGPEHPDVAVALNGLAIAYNNQGRYAEAEPIILRGVRIREKALGTDHPSVAQSLNSLAILYDLQGRFAEAEPVYQRTLKIREKALGTEHPDVAETLHNMAVLYRLQGRYDEARPIIERSLKIREKAFGIEHPAVAASLNNLAVLYTLQGRYTEAEPLQMRVLKIQEKALGSGNPALAESLGDLAMLYSLMGRYAEAEPLQMRVLEILEKVLGREHPNVAIILSHLAASKSEQGRYQDAEPLQQRALNIQEKVLGSNHPDVAMSLHNLANLYDLQGRYAEAESVYQRSLKIREKGLGGEHPYVAMSLTNLATLYEQQGRHAEAEPLYLRALKINEKALGSEHPDVAMILNNLAVLYDKQGRYVEAEQLIERAVTLWDKSDRAAHVGASIHYVRSNISWHLGRRADAVASLTRAIDLVEVYRSKGSGGEQERAQLFSKFQPFYEQLVALHRELGNTAEALAAVERSRARGLLDQIAVAQMDLIAGVPEAEAERLRTADLAAQQLVAELEQQLAQAYARRSPAKEELEKSLLAARGRVAESFAAIRNASPSYRQMVGRDFKPASLEEVQRRIAGDDKLVLEYLLGEEAGYLFVIPPGKQTPWIEMLTLDKQQAEILEVSAGPLTKDVLRKILSRGDRKGGVLDLLGNRNESVTAIKKLHALWQVLIPAPQRETLTAGNLKQLVVIPDGPLAMLPFDTLVVEHQERLRYLLDAGPPIISAASSTLLLNLMDAAEVAATQGLKPVLSVGDPAYDAGEEKPDSRGAFDFLSARSRYISANGPLKRLPFSGTEVNWVAEVFGEHGFTAHKLLYDAATEQAVRYNLPGRKIVHFACHGGADQSYGNLFGALAFARGSKGTDDPADDGFLTLAEIYGLDLKGCELTILSACDTNVGPEQKGEGTWALSRGFLVSGSRRVVASNWVVDDEAAASLISYFCSIVAKDKRSGTVDHAAALQQAKQWIRKQGPWETPYYWGTFALIGPQ